MRRAAIFFLVFFFLVLLRFRPDLGAFGGFGRCVKVVHVAPLESSAACASFGAATFGSASPGLMFITTPLKASGRGITVGPVATVSRDLERETPCGLLPVAAIQAPHPVGMDAILAVEVLPRHAVVEVDDSDGVFVALWPAAPVLDPLARGLEDHLLAAVEAYRTAPGTNHVGTKRVEDACHDMAAEFEPSHVYWRLLAVLNKADDESAFRSRGTGLGLPRSRNPGYQELDGVELVHLQEEEVNISAGHREAPLAAGTPSECAVDLREPRRPALLYSQDCQTH